MGAFNAEALVDGLRKSFGSGKTKTIEWRRQQLEGIMRLMEEREQEIVDALKADLNKPSKEGLREINIVRRSAVEALAQIEEWAAPTKVTSEVPLYADSELIPEPLGVVLNMSPWNYPFALSLDPVVGAVAAGNAVAVKPSAVASATAELLAKLVPLYMDSSAVCVVLGSTDVKKAILEQRWDKIFYTGSPRIGRIVMQAAAKHLTPVILELGGKSPVIVDSTANLASVAQRVTQGKWSYNNGQTCLSPDYLLVDESVVPQLIESFRDTMKKAYGEDPKNSPDLARIINKDQFKRLRDLMTHETKEDQIVIGGNCDEESLFFEPTVMLDPPTDAPVMQEEVFGPLLVIISTHDLAEAIAFVNARPKPLALYVFSENAETVERVKSETSSGGITVNDILLHVFNTDLPFGGVGESGMGQYHGKYSFEAFSHSKAVLYRHPSHKLASAAAPDRI